jgi:exodeoxyribonuclease-3
MKIATWNINSIRAREERLVEYLATRSPDVLCLQELKCEDDCFPAEAVQRAGYRVAFHGQKTYNGVAILSREEPADVFKGLQDGVEDPQSRVIAATVRGVRVVTVYAPNGQSPGTPAYDYKLEWYRRLRAWLERHTRPNELVLVCGDFNVAPDDRDLYDPVGLAGGIMLSGPEREAFQTLLAFGFTDAFRALHPEGGRYTWWDYRQLSFPHNRGMRIDHALLTAPLRERLKACDIDREMRKGKKPSDHAPLWLEVDL